MKMEDFVIKKMVVVVETTDGRLVLSEVAHPPHALAISNEVFPKYGVNEVKNFKSIQINVEQ